MIVVAMLIHIVSFEFRLPPCANVFSLCSDIKLALPIYFGNGIVCPKLTSKQIDIETKMNASFEVNAIQDDFEGALLFKLQRYSDGQYKIDLLTTENNEETCIQVFVAWKVKDSVPFAYVVLIEHTKSLTWNEDKLKKLYDKNHGRLKKYYGTISDTWLMDNNVILKTTFSAKDLKSTPELSISISKKEKDSYAMKPFCINLER
jgi:hypothetical protein